MYRGNMNNYVEKLNAYIGEKYGLECRLFHESMFSGWSRVSLLSEEYHFYISKDPRSVIINDLKGVEDREDFEEQVIKLVNNYLKKAGYV